jgi:HAD superfamily hydrolase (TIGR01509 family)
VSIDLTRKAGEESRKMEKDSQPLQAVLFDMDGTLIDTERIGHASWDHAGKDVGMEVSIELKDSMVGRNLPDIQRMVRDYYPDHNTEGLLDRANFHYHRLVTEAPPPIKSGALELLNWLQGKGVPMALATSSRYDQAEDKLGRSGLRDFFSFVIAGDQVSQGKPHPEIFQRAAQGLQIPIGTCAVFEDSGPGIEAAYHAGAFAVLVPENWPAKEEWAVYAHRVLPNLTEAKALLEEKGL